MESLNVLLQTVKAALEADEDLQSFAEALKSKVAGTAGKFRVVLGAETTSREIPTSNLPFICIVVGGIDDLEENGFGTTFKRRLNFQVGMVDTDVERGTAFSVELDELAYRVIDRILGELTKGGPSGKDLILGHSVVSVMSDNDINRPAILRLVQVDVKYTL